MLWSGVGWILLLIRLVGYAHAAVTSADLARRFGVAESSLSGSKQSWKVECSETSEDFFERFRDLDEITTFMKTSIKDKLQGTVFSIGTTAQDREILAVQVGSSSKTSPIILAMAGLHGREWTSVAALLYSMHMLTREELKDVTVVFVPVINPDGYAKTFDGGTHTKERYKHGVGTETDLDQPNRYWRKNGVGVDLNRNFGSNWYNDTKKSSKMKNSDVYQGSQPFSERETRALREWAKENIDRLAAIIDFHCCIGAVLGPPVPRSTSEISRKDNERVGMKIVAALSQGGKGVTHTVKGGDGVPGAYEWRTRDPKDPGAGLSSSWGFLDLLVDLTFVVEMRGKFVAPCFEIRQLGKEALFAMRALVGEVGRRPVLGYNDRKRTRYTTQERLGSQSNLSVTSVLIVALACFAVIVYVLFARGKLGRRSAVVKE